MFLSTRVRVLRTAAVLAPLLALVLVGCEPVPPTPQPRLPIIFVHGQSGSAQQFESQAMRFTSNGFPQRLIYAYEYDSSRQDNTAEIWAGLDEYIARVRGETGARRVDVLAHSRGTGIVQGYLRSSTARAALVRNYVNYDGATSADPPGGVRTLAIWGEGAQTRKVGGAANVYLANQGHTQTVSSPESFAIVWAFLTGTAAATTEVLPPNGSRITLGGRSVYFQENVGPVGARLELWRVDPDTGARLEAQPRYAKTLDATGEFGPMAADTRETYEISVSRTNTMHFYFSPFTRSDHFLRLNLSREGQGLELVVDRSPNHSSIVNLRSKEFWAGQPNAADNDRLLVNGTDVLNAATSPRSRRIIAPFVFDDGSDRVSNLSGAIPPFNALPFLTAVDLYVPAHAAHDRVTTLAQIPRGGGGRIEVINVPTWPSSTDGITVQWRDYVRTPA